jgi:hypothetical protein
MLLSTTVPANPRRRGETQEPAHSATHIAAKFCNVHVALAVKGCRPRPVQGRLCGLTPIATVAGNALSSKGCGHRCVGVDNQHAVVHGVCCVTHSAAAGAGVNKCGLWLCNSLRLYSSPAHGHHIVATAELYQSCCCWFQQPPPVMKTRPVGLTDTEVGLCSGTWEAGTPPAGSGTGTSSSLCVAPVPANSSSKPLVRFTLQGWEEKPQHQSEIPPPCSQVS